VGNARFAIGPKLRMPSIQFQLSCYHFSKALRKRRLGFVDFGSHGRAGESVPVVRNPVESPEQTLRIWLASVGERPSSSTDPPERALRMSLLADAIVRGGGEVTWWSTAFDHTHKRIVTPKGMRYRVGPRYEVILTAGPGYRHNVSVRRLIFNFRTSRQIAQLATIEPKPDLILTSYPPIEVVSELAAYGRRHSIPTIADIRDLWPDIWLDAAPAAARPIAKLLLSPYFALSRSSLASITAITGMTDEFVAWGQARAGRTAGAFDRAFPFGYSLPTLTPDMIGLANQFWNELLENGKAQPALRLCLIGRIGERTGHDHVIEAVRLLPPEAKARVQLVICGVDLRQATAKYQVDPAIVYAGWVDQSKVITLMERSDLGIIPYPNTIDFQNSLSNKTIEYLAGGLALTTGLEGKVRQLIVDNNCGYLYASQSAPSYRNLLLEILADRQTLERRKKAARKLYQERFRADSVYGDFTDYLFEVVAAHRRG
jgi:glycosyltransferase involved in cell wall biosynthesis